jgi:hypothetical protein
MNGMNEREPITESDAESNPLTSNGNSKKRWQFPKGRSGNPGGKPKSGAEAAKARRPKLLHDMRLVYGQDESKDRTPGQKALRKILNKNAKTFIEQLAGLEKAHLATTGKAVVPENSDLSQSTKPEVVDEGTARAEALIEKLLDEYEAEQAEAATPFALPNSPASASVLQHQLAASLQREKRLRERVEALERNGTGRF